MTADRYQQPPKIDLENFNHWVKTFNTRFDKVIEQEKAASKISPGNAIRIGRIKTRGTMSPTLLYDIAIVAGDLKINLNWLFGNVD